MRKPVCDIGEGKDFLNMSQKYQAQKNKIDKLDYIKAINLY